MGHPSKVISKRSRIIRPEVHFPSPRLLAMNVEIR